MERKRYTVRLPKVLSVALKSIANERGLSLNALIIEMSWDFIGEFKQLHNETKDKYTEGE